MRQKLKLRAKLHHAGRAGRRQTRQYAGCPLASSPVAKIVQVFQFLTQASTYEHAEAVTEYIKRMPGEMQSLFINSVANSTAIGLFATNKIFGKMLAENRKFFN